MPCPAPNIGIWYSFIKWINDLLWLKEVRYMNSITDCLTSRRASWIVRLLTLIFTVILKRSLTTCAKLALVVIPTISINHWKVSLSIYKYIMFQNEKESSLLSFLIEIFFVLSCLEFSEFLLWIVILISENRWPRFSFFLLWNSNYPCFRPFNIFSKTIDALFLLTFSLFSFCFGLGHFH